MTGSVAVRRLSFADLPAVVAIERRSFGAPWSLAMFVLELSKPAGVSLAAVRGGRLAGYLVCSRYDDVWHLMNVAVDPDLRRRGTGRALMDHLLERLGDGVRITLEVRPGNVAAVTMYERYGFLPAGTRPRYYADTGEDALIMWRTPGTLRGTLDDVPAAPS